MSTDFEWRLFLGRDTFMWAPVELRRDFVPRAWGADSVFVSRYSTGVSVSLSQFHTVRFRTEAEALEYLGQARKFCYPSIPRVRALRGYDKRTHWQTVGRETLWAGFRLVEENL